MHPINYTNNLINCRMNTRNGIKRAPNTANYCRVFEKNTLIQSGNVSENIKYEGDIQPQFHTGKYILQCHKQ